MSACELYEESYWEIYDPQNARIVAQAFDEGLAQKFVDFLNTPPPAPAKKKWWKQ